MKPGRLTRMAAAVATGEPVKGSAPTVVKPLCSRKSLRGTPGWDVDRCVVEEQIALLRAMYTVRATEAD